MMQDDDWGERKAAIDTIEKGGRGKGKRIFSRPKCKMELNPNDAKIKKQWREDPKNPGAMMKMMMVSV